MVLTAQYKLEIDSHPAQALHPFTKKPLFDDDGKPIPLFPDEKSIRLDGRIIAYVTKDRAIMWLYRRDKLGAIADAAVELVEKEFGSPATAEVESQGSPVPQNEEDDEDAYD